MKNANKKKSGKGKCKKDILLQRVSFKGRGQNAQSKRIAKNSYFAHIKMRIVVTAL